MRQPWGRGGVVAPFSLGLGEPLGGLGASFSLALGAPFCLALGVPLGWGRGIKWDDTDDFGTDLRGIPRGRGGDITLSAQNFFYRCKCLI